MRLLAALVLFAALLPACAAIERWRLAHEEGLPAPRAFRDESLDFGMVRRVLLLPIVDESARGAAPEDPVQWALREELQAEGVFQVVLPTEGQHEALAEALPARSGRVPVGALIELGRNYGVDAVLFAQRTVWRPYPPPALGLALDLVDVETGRVLWSVSDLVDASERRAAVSLDRYFLDRWEEDETVMGKEVLRTSPRHFARFVAHRIAGTLTAPRAVLAGP